MRSNSKRSKKNASTQKHTSAEICKLHTFSEKEIENLQGHLLSWYESNKRDLPWRKIAAEETDRNRRGYAVWVSEVMLQQTQVVTVIEYYHKWMNRWPTLQDLAKASLEEVNEMWAGLGYYSRAKRLHEACIKVVNEMNGELPGDAAGLLKSLPGVGRYTAAAIASIAFNKVVGLVDGNVVRVLSRLRVIGTDSSSAAAVETFWQLVDEIISKDHPGDFNQAVMELGATVCTPKSPQCTNCPVQEICLAYKQKKQNAAHQSESGITSFFESLKQTSNCPTKLLTDIEEIVPIDCQLCLPKDSSWDPELGVCNYPRKAKGREACQEKIAVCILECKCDEDTLLFLAKRAPTGLLAGLWEFPNFVIKYEERVLTEVREFIIKEFQIVLPDNYGVSQLGQVVHQFSHIHHTYVVYKIFFTMKLEEHVGKSVNGRSTKWIHPSEFLQMAVSTAMKKVYSLSKNVGQKKAASGKRKRVEKDGNKRQKVIDSFFVKR